MLKLEINSNRITPPTDEVWSKIISFLYDDENIRNKRSSKKALQELSNDQLIGVIDEMNETIKILRWHNDNMVSQIQQMVLHFPPSLLEKVEKKDEL